MDQIDLYHGTDSQSDPTLCRLIRWLACDRQGSGPTQRGSEPGRVRRLWLTGRPVLFLAALCVLAGLSLAGVSMVLALVFFSAAAAAVGLFLWLSDLPGGALQG
jgi:hypothetical protein